MESGVRLEGRNAVTNNDLVATREASYETQSRPYFEMLGSYVTVKLIMMLTISAPYSKSRIEHHAAISLVPC